MTAYVIGNGVSRKPIQLNKLNGMTYGCNALYRDFQPDVLVATDDPISRAIQESGYPRYKRFHTRKVFAGSGARPLRQQYAGWSSGPNALQLAVLDKHKDIVIIGFDFGSTHKSFNNVYANTDFYRKSHETATYGGNWVHQVDTIIRHAPNVNFTFVVSKDTRSPPQFQQHRNVEIMDIREFLKTINNV